MRYLPLTPDDRAAMLSAIGASSIDDLFVDVPEAARLDGNHRRAHHSPRVGSGPARVLAHLRNLLRSINTHHARE